MVKTRELEEKSFAALSSYAKHIGATADELYKALADEERFSELASSFGLEINSDDWLLLHAHMVFIFANASRNKESLQIEEVIEWAAAYGFLCGKLAIKFSATIFDPVSNGKKGLQARHENIRKLKAWSIEKYQAGKWNSANEAACSLVDDIIEHGRTIGAYLKKSNAQRTIAEWFRRSV